MKKLCLIFLVGSFSTNFAMANDCDWVSQVFDYINRERGLSRQCVMLIEHGVARPIAETEVKADAPPKRVSVGAYEKHDEVCGGDPYTAPAIAFFDVNLPTCEIFTENLATLERIRVK